MDKDLLEVTIKGHNTKSIEAVLVSLELLNFLKDIAELVLYVMYLPLTLSKSKYQICKKNKSLKMPKTKSR